MTSATPTAAPTRTTSALADAIDEACAALAPTWPLDRSIAVNPFWELRGLDHGTVAARLADRSGARLLPTSEHLRAMVDDGRIDADLLRRAADELGEPAPAPRDLAQLDAPPLPPLPLLTHWLDARRDLEHVMSWDEEVTHQISQFCASFFDRGQARWTSHAGGSLYAAWRELVARDRGLAILMGAPQVADALARLPRSADELFAVAHERLALPDHGLPRYAHALLLDLVGWSSWCAYRRWEARLAGGDDRSLRELLAVRLAWDLALLDGATDARTADAWRETLAYPVEHEARQHRAQSAARVWLRAAELAYQLPLARRLAEREGAASPASRPQLQAVFCIDVRSEVLRRHLETHRPGTRTLGFAGFFGVPIEHRPLGASSARPQLPGLLAPRLTASDHVDGDTPLAERRLADDARGHEHLTDARLAPVANFGAVEAFGWLDAWRLVRGPRPAAPSDDGVRPQLDGTCLAERVDLAAGILRAMSPGELAPLVLLVGHASSSLNNPGAAALDCGACCGGSGLVNARLAASLLNDADVRAGLAARGAPLPDDTWFAPGRHDTTTQRVTLHDVDDAPASHRERIARAQAALDAAAAATRAELAPRLGLSDLSPARLERALARRAADWSQTRPEWGLANNAAFVVAPRERTRDLDLGGRAFLHEYRRDDDEGFAVLEQILTAPMLVTHWINAQYNASTLDPLRYGSGNKVLHNVVGGTLGVFEGNGGDLRIGLSRQSLHDGARWMHEPLRLSVFVDAPRAAIAAIIEAHDVLRELVDNGWLYLFALDDGVARLHRGAWHDVD